MPSDTSHLANPSGANYRGVYADLVGMLAPPPDGATPTASCPRQVCHG
jgi:hypothetical protein